MMDKTGTITLSTPAAANLFLHEVRGQMSDGLWENTRPYDHWRWWCGLGVVVGDRDQVESDSVYACRKWNYGLTRLVQYVGDRMINLVSMGTAAGRLLTYEEGMAAAYMPVSWRDWSRQRLEADWPARFIEGYMDSLTLELGVAFYQQQTTLRDVRRELGHIKRAMNTVRVQTQPLGW